jgi:predicted heme/steroid binding protein
MKRIYAGTEDMMTECFDLNPVEGVEYATAQAEQQAKEPPAPIPEADQVELSLEELHEFTGNNGDRIFLSLAGELLDVSVGRDIYGPGEGYSMLAGHDATRCLATMSLDPAHLDDLAWTPETDGDRQALSNWQEKLKAKYPVAGRLKAGQVIEERRKPETDEGLRQRSVPSAAAETAAGTPDSQKCPISGKEGMGCPMSFMGIGAGKQTEAAQPVKEPTAKATAKAKSGFMAGKSLVAAVEKPKSSGGESFLYKLCPVHWDDNTMKLILVVAALSWASGFFVGYKIRGSLL